ncbi:MAG: phosphoglycerate kinase [Deltaproteobacteria bacterium]|nr:phosphoglycerate kinase [Deltaproteobacteria bacterium]
MIHTLDELHLKDKKIFLRVDFNVPLKDGTISETHRIDSTLPTLRHLGTHARKVIVASHLGRPGGKIATHWSLAPVQKYLASALSLPVAMAPDCIGPEVENLVGDPTGPKIVLLENLRFHPEEEANDSGFSKALASLAEVYVNDAFGAAHRAHASTAGMVRYFREKAAGLLFQKELDYLGAALSHPDKPFAAVLGGAKVSDKIGVIQNLLPKVDRLIIGGGMAYTFLKSRGTAIGKSLVEDERISLASDLMKQATDRGIRIFLPTDHVTAKSPKESRGKVVSQLDIPDTSMGLDIGPETVASFCQALSDCKTVLWNGPLGLFENEPFSGGTLAVARALAGCSGISIIAGGDTVAAVAKAGVAEKMTHLSTGGGATLEFLEGKKLPGVLALEDGP